MSKSATIKRDIRFQQWVLQVQEFNERPEGMSMTTWCKLHDIPVSTFTTRLHKVQDRCLEKMELTPVIPSGPIRSVPVEPNFVEIPSIMHANSNTATLICGNAKIEVSEDISESFLIKLIGAMNHAQ